MDVWLCPECIPIAKWPVYEEGDITNQRFSPWTAKEVESLKAYQRSMAYFPFVCAAHHVLQVTQMALHCPLCFFALEWTYPWTLDWSWKEDLGYRGDEPNAPVPRRPMKPLGGKEIALNEPRSEKNSADLG